MPVQIDDDVQRHDELLEVIRKAPSEFSAIVSRRRKDFTKEFFVHLHTVAESYYENPTEQNGKIEFIHLHPMFYEILLNNELLNVDKELIAWIT